MLPVVVTMHTCGASFRVTDEGDDVRDTLCLKRQNKHYNPLIEWFEEVCVFVCVCAMQCLSKRCI